MRRFDHAKWPGGRIDTHRSAEWTAGAANTQPRKAFLSKRPVLH